MDNSWIIQRREARQWGGEPRGRGEHTSKERPWKPVISILEMGRLSLESSYLSLANLDSFIHSHRDVVIQHLGFCKLLV